MGLLGRSYKSDLLRSVPLFRDLSKRNLDAVAKYADEVRKKKGSVLAQQGSRGQEFIFIIEGEARVERDGKVINRLSANDFFGEIALIDQRPRLATVVADTDVRLLVVHASSFKQLLEAVPGLAYKIMVGLCKYLREAEA
jgi:CRP/FNR family cyclic AMP-dependent transcriptional regulator